jgi:uncharacterized membrane protein
MIKTITFAVMHFSIAFAVVYAMTGSLLMGGAVAIVEPAVNTVAFHFHEKIWKRIEQSGGTISFNRFRSMISA